MKQLVCEACGSSDLIKQDGVFVCQACGHKPRLMTITKVYPTTDEENKAGVVICGTIENESVSIGSNVMINGQILVVVELTESNRNTSTASAGISITMRLRDAIENNFKVGDEVYLHRK